MTVKQLTVLTGNSTLDLRKVLADLSLAGVDLRAHCLVDNGEGNCKLRLVVSEPEKATAVFQESGLAAVTNDVVIIEADDRPGALNRLLTLLDGDDIRIAYSYTAASENPGRAVMVFRFSDNSKATRILEKNGIRVLKTEG